jgi:hypothetical protein
MHRKTRHPDGIRLAFASTGLLLAACSTGPARVPAIIVPETGTGGSPINSTTLRTQAEAIVRTSFLEAILVEVIGTPSTGTAATASDVNTFEFRFAVSQTDPTAGTAWVDAINGNFGLVQSSFQQLTDTTFTELPNTLTLEQAVSLLRGAGFNASFRRVIFRQLPGTAEASYAFDMNGLFVLVGALSQTVSEAGPQPEPNMLIPNT